MLTISHLNPYDYFNYNKENTVLLDVRSKTEFNNDHIEGAENIHVDELRKNLNILDKNKEILEYCQSGIKSCKTYGILHQLSFKEVIILVELAICIMN